MKTTENVHNKKVKLTELEYKVYESLKKSETIPMKELRGVISSLIKKDVAYVDELVSGCGEWLILFEEKHNIYIKI